MITEQDGKEFEAEFRKAGGYNLHETVDITSLVYLWSRWSWLASRRTLREKMHHDHPHSTEQAPKIPTLDFDETE